MTVSQNSLHVPLVCDLDGTLTRTDTTHELLILFLKRNPFFGWLQVLLWVRSGRAHMKERLYAAVGAHLDTADLPYCTELMHSPQFISARQKALVSGAAQPVVESVAEQITGFDGVVGSTATVNMTSRTKADYLSRAYPNGFDYVGNSKDDLAIWEQARKAYAVNAPASVIAAARDKGVALEVLVPRTPQWAGLWKAVRLHQWTKNALLGVIPALNLPHLTAAGLGNLVVAFVAFGFVASATYLLNDLLDIGDDRKHTKKSARPFAAGTLDVVNGGAAMVALFALGFVLGLLVDTRFGGMLLFYAALSMSYSLYLKRVVILDAMTLAFLFCWRIIAGGVVIGAVAEVWFMTAVGAFFLSLAFGKRCIELDRRRRKGDASGALHGRGYQVVDFPVVLGLGLVTGMMAPLIVLIYVYLSQTSIVDHNLSALSLASVLCFWIGRFWILVNRGEVEDDPIVFALKDRHSVLLLGGMALVLVLEQVI